MSALPGAGHRRLISLYDRTDSMNKNNTDILEHIGNTPLVRLGNLDGTSKVKIFGKLEGTNPGGSVKDRPAYCMIKMAEKSGELTEDKTIIEPTSGNMGIAMALIGAVRGYRVKLFMPECVSVERQLVLQAYGAEVVLTPAREGVDGAIKRAREALAAEPDKYYMPNQFENPNNALAHYNTTGPEIYDQTGGQVDVFIAGMGTTGTLMGTGRYLKEKKSTIKVIGVEPTEGHTIQGLKNMVESSVPPIFSASGLDEKITIEDEEAFETARLLALKEGILVGMSSGAAVAGALRVAEAMKQGTIVTILPDRGDRYLSTTLFRSYCAKCPP